MRGVLDWVRKLRDGHEEEELFLTGREARRRAGRHAGVLKGGRDHVSRMSGRRKAPPSLATHLGVPTDDGIVRVWHPGYIEKLRAQKADQ